jgi:anhydro-N-acetylmuramic acid kinase
MSGTSLDGVDAALAEFGPTGQRTIATASIGFPADLRARLMTLQAPSDNELHEEALAANSLAHLYAECVHAVLQQAGLAPAAIKAIGVHGQTIRHRPESGYTRQTNNPALLAELTGIDVIADFRSRDIAAGGQGAPLVPAFHQAVFSSDTDLRVVANIGGISNISVLASGNSQPVIGFDTGPGNVLLDAWVSECLGVAYDAGGAWAASGALQTDLLAAMRQEAFFSLPPPKSTGRDLFHRAWLATQLAQFPGMPAADVQATLAALTATTLADAIAEHAANSSAVYVCGGGAFNTHLLRQLQSALRERGLRTMVKTTDALGIAAGHVEALAFAWLARCHVERLPGNLASVTGARGPRILGALYPR